MQTDTMQRPPETDWPFRMRPLSPGLGVEITGVDLADDLDSPTFDAIRRAFLRYQVLLFPPQDVPPERQVRLARCFGEVQIHVMNQYHAGGIPELYRLSNLDDQGKPNGRHPDRGTLAWHTDGSWRRVTGHATIIYGELMPMSEARPISATCTAPTIDSTRPGRRASPACARCTTWIFHVTGGMAKTR